MTDRPAAGRPCSGERAPLRRAATWWAPLLTAALVVSGCAGGADDRPTEPPGSAVTPTAAPSAASSPLPAPPSAEPVPALAPTGVRIPAIDIDASLIDLGIADDGSMQVPEFYDEVGWFTGGGRPGGRGPLVIAAHVASPTGWGAFARLAELAPGDTVEVTDEAGSVFRYVVTEVGDYAKDAFPTARVFGATPDDRLRLITCITLDTALNEYVDNRVVFAERILDE